MADSVSNTERRLSPAQYWPHLEGVADLLAAYNLSDAPEIPNFEEKGSSDGSFHVGIPMGIPMPSTERRLSCGNDYKDVLENMGAMAASNSLSDAPEIPEFEERGSSDGSFHVGIMPGLDALENMADSEFEERGERRLAWFST